MLREEYNRKHYSKQTCFTWYLTRPSCIMTSIWRCKMQRSRLTAVHEHKSRKAMKIASPNMHFLEGKRPSAENSERYIAVPCFFSIVSCFVIAHGRQAGTLILAPLRRRFKLGNVHFPEAICPKQQINTQKPDLPGHALAWEVSTKQALGEYSVETKRGGRDFLRQQ